MNIKETKDRLAELAENDLCDGSDIYDHPCSVASRMIDIMRDDVEFLIATINKRLDVRPLNSSLRLNRLANTKYNPKT